MALPWQRLNRGPSGSFKNLQCFALACSCLVPQIGWKSWSRAHGASWAGSSSSTRLCMMLPICSAGCTDKSKQIGRRRPVRADHSLGLAMAQPAAGQDMWALFKQQQQAWLRVQQLLSWCDSGRHLEQMGAVGPCGTCSQLRNPSWGRFPSHKRLSSALQQARAHPPRDLAKAAKEPPKAASHSSEDPTQTW